MGEHGEFALGHQRMNIGGSPEKIMNGNSKIRRSMYPPSTADAAREAEECRETEATWLPITWRSLPPFRPPIGLRQDRTRMLPIDIDHSDKGVAVELVYVPMEKFARIYASEVGNSPSGLRAMTAAGKGGAINAA